jgi:osmotically-inducible protein OsmY
MAGSTLTRTDSDIQRDVRRELKCDSRVDETDVGVRVDAGVVTLTGTVGSWGKRVAAEEAAHRALGVLDVANDIVVKAPGKGSKTDTEIAQAVRNALAWDVFVPDTRIQSTVSQGLVVIKGEVDSWLQREDAEKAVRNLAGVRAVGNDIAVKPPRASAAEVRKAIESALDRQAEKEAHGIRLDVQDGQVKLFGTVSSWAERQTVLGAAKGTPGVRSVEDHLRIEPSF